MAKKRKKSSIKKTEVMYCVLRNNGTEVVVSDFEELAEMHASADYLGGLQNIQSMGHEFGMPFKWEPVKAGEYKGMSFFSGDVIDLLRAAGMLGASFETSHEDPNREAMFYFFGLAHLTKELDHDQIQIMRVKVYPSGYAEPAGRMVTLMDWNDWEDKGNPLYMNMFDYGSGMDPEIRAVMEEELDKYPLVRENWEQRQRKRSDG